MGMLPDWKIIEKDKVSGKYKKVGAGWTSERGGVSLSIGEGAENRKFILKKDDYEERRSNPLIYQKAIQENQKELPTTLDFSPREECETREEPCPF